jgi:organic hydroperoxide reductase OsmC/OhrA
MSEYTLKVIWTRNPDETYSDNKYSRGHAWIFDGGLTVPASSSPHVVPLPYSIEQNVDPEEAFIAALSSCHMLFFLSLAAKKQFVVDEYQDNPIGLLEKDAEGKTAMTMVTLRPKIKFSGGRRPTREQLETIHHQSHDQCFIANSVKTEIVIEVLP